MPIKYLYEEIFKTLYFSVVGNLAYLEWFEVIINNIVIHIFKLNFLLLNYSLYLKSPEWEIIALLAICIYCIY